jgi:hypothetical protein
VSTLASGTALFMCLGAAVALFFGQMAMVVYLLFRRQVLLALAVGLLAVVGTGLAREHVRHARTLMGVAASAGLTAMGLPPLLLFGLVRARSRRRARESEPPRTPR